MEEQDVQTSKNRSMQSDALLHIIIINFYFAHLIYSYEYLNSKYLLNLIQNYNLVHIQYSTNLKGKSGAPKSKPKKTVEKTITFIWSQFWGCISSRCLYYKQLQGISKQGYADPPFSFSPIIMKDAKCVESNEKSIFRFLFFELWSFLNSKHPNFRWIFTITRQIKIGKLIFHSLQHVPHLSWKPDQNWGR